MKEVKLCGNSCEAIIIDKPNLWRTKLRDNRKLNLLPQFKDCLRREKYSSRVKIHRYSNVLSTVIYSNQKTVGRTAKWHLRDFSFSKYSVSNVNRGEYHFSAIYPLYIFVRLSSTNQINVKHLNAISKSKHDKPSMVYSKYS